MEDMVCPICQERMKTHSFAMHGYEYKNLKISIKANVTCCYKHYEDCYVITQDEMTKYTKRVQLVLETIHARYNLDEIIKILSANEMIEIECI